MSSGRQPQWSLGCDAAPLGNSVLAASDAKWQPGRAASLLDKSRGGSSPLDVLLQAVEPDLTLLRQANDDESGDVAEQCYGTLTAEQQTQMRPKPREPGLASPHAYVLAQEKHGGNDGQFNKTASAEHRHKGGAQPEQSLHCGDDESQNRIQVAPRPGEQRPQTQWGEQQQHLRQQRFVAPPHGGARYRVRGGVVQYVYPTQYSRAGPPAPPSQQPPHVPLPAQGTRRAGPLPSSQEGPSESSGPYAAPCYVPAEVKGGQVYAQYRGQSGRGRPARDRDSRPKKPGKYVCPYCGRACAKPSVLKKHIRSHTGERPYPCLACGFAFKTKSNLYKHRKSHAHAVKAGLVCGTDDGGSGDWTEIEKSFSLERSASAEKSLALEEQLGVGKLEIDQEAHSELDESTDTDDETAVEDASLDVKDYSARLLSESCFDYGQQRVKMSPCQTELSADTKGKHDGDRLQDNPQQRSGEENAERMSGSAKGSQGTGDMQSFLPRVVLVPPNPSASPSAQFTDSFRKPLTSDVNVCMEESEKQRSPKPKLNWSAKVTEEANLRSASSENLLRPNTFGSKSSTDSGYFSRSESADQPLTSPTNFHPLSYKDIVLGRNFPIHSRGRAMPNRVPEHIEEVSLKKERLVSSWTPSEHSISLNTERKPSNTQPTAQQATIDRSHVAGSIDSSGATDTYRDGGGTGTDDKMSKMAIAAAIYKPGPVKSEAGGEYLLVPSLETLGFPRSNSMPSYTRPDDTEVKTPVPLRGSHSFDEPASTFHGDAYSSSSSSNLYFANHRSLVRQTAVQADEFPVASESKVPTASQSSRVSMVGASQNLQDTGEGLNVGRRASPTMGEQHVRARRPARYSRGSFYECHTCKVTYKKVENYIVHKRLYCSELHMFPSSSNSSLEMESPVVDVAHEGETGAGKASDRSVLIRKRRKQRSVGDEEDMLTECVSASIAQPMLSGFIEEPYLDDHDSVFEKHDVPEGPRDVGVTAPVTVNSQAPKWQHSDPVKPQPPQLLVDGGSRRGLSLESGLSCYSSLGGHNEISVIQHTKSLSQPSSFERADSLETARSLSPDGCKGAQWSQQQQQCSLPALQATEHNKEDQASSADPLSIRGTKLVRQNNIQVPEILVTEEPDLVQPTDAPEKESEKKMEEDFSWPKRSETLSQLPPEKLPPKKKRLRLAELGNSSFESSTDSSFSGSLSRSPSLESNLSRCSSLSISLDRVELDDEKPKAELEEKPRQEEVAFLTVPTSHHHRQHHHSREMRRSASEQARSPQYAGPGMAEIRSKSFDCGSISNSPPPPLGLDMDSSQPLTSSPLRERRKMCLVRQTSLSGYSEVQESLKEHIAFTSQAGLHPPPPRPASPALLSLRYCSPETSMRPPSPQSATQNMEDFKWQMGQKASYLDSLKPQMSSCSPPRLPHSHHLPQSGHMQPPLAPFVHPSQAHNYELSLQHLSQTPQRLPYQLVHNHMLQLQAQQLLLRLPLQPFPQPPGVFYHQQGSPPRPRESYKQDTQHGLRGLDTAVQAEVVTYPAVTFSLGEPPLDEAGSDRLPSSRMQRSSAEGAWSSNSLVAPPLHHSKSSHKLVVHTTLAGLLSTQGPGSQPRVLFGQRGAASLSEKHTKLMRTDSAMRSSVLYPLYDNNKVVAVCASRQGISSQLDNQAPSSKRMLSPASSLEIAVDMRRQHYQKRVKEGEEESELREVEEEASLVIDKRDKSQPLIKSEGFTKSSSSFNSTDSSRSRKPTLVRQFCTMEPADREGSPANLTDSSSVQSMSSPSRDAKGMAASEDSMDEGSPKSPPLELGKRDNCSGRSAPEHEAGVLKSAASNADIEMKDSLGSPTTIKVLVPIVTTDMASSRATDSREEMAGGLGGPRRPPARAGVKVAVLHVVASGVSVPPSLVLVANIAEVQQLLSPSLRTVVSTTWCFLNGRARPAHCVEHHPGGAPGPSAYGQWTPPAPAGASAGDPNPPGASTAEALALLRRARGGHAGEGVYTLAAIAPRGACSTVHSRLWMPCMALGAMPAAEPKATGAGRGRAAGPGRERGELEGRGAQDSAGPEPPPMKGGPQPSRIKIFEGGYKSNEEYVYVRGRGRGKYVCEECGIRCKKPSMLRKHIRSHSDLRPYRCHICSFAFKTKGNLTKHMKSKTHSKKCLEMGLTLVPVDDTDPEEAALENAHKKSSGEHQFSDADVSDGDREEEENEDDDDEDDEDDEVDAIAGLARRPGDHSAEDSTTAALSSAGDGWGPQGPRVKLYKAPGSSFDAEVESLTSQFRAFPYSEGGKSAQQGSAGDKQHQHSAGFGRACWDSYSPHAMSINSESVAPSPGQLMNASLSPSQMSVSREGSPCTGEGERSSSPNASPSRAYSPGRVYSPACAYSPGRAYSPCRAASDPRDDSTIDPFAAHYTEQLASNKLLQVQHQHHPPHHHHLIHHHFQQQASVSRLSVPFCERASRQQESATQQQTQQSRDSLVPSRPRGHRAHSLSPYRRGSSGRPCSPSPSREAYSGAAGGGGSSSILRAQSLSPSRWSALRAADGPKNPDGGAGAARSPPCRSPPVDAAHHGVRDGLDCRPRPPWGDDAVTPSPASLPPADEEGSDPRVSAMRCGQRSRGTGGGSFESAAADQEMETCGGWAEARGVERGTAQPQDGYGRSLDPKTARAGLRTQPSLVSASWHRQMFSHLPLHSQQPEGIPTPKILVDGMRTGMGGSVYPLPPAPGAEEAMAALSTSARSNWAAVRDVEWRQQAFALLSDTQQLQQQQQHQQPVWHSSRSGFTSTMLPLSAIHSASRSSPGFSRSASPASATSQMCGAQQQQQRPQDGNVGLSKDHNS